MLISEIPKYELTEKEIEAIGKIISNYHGRQGALIPVLKEIQDAIGFLPIQAQRKVAGELNIPEKDVYGVVTFYSFFTMIPRGKYNIRVCMGTACFVKGANIIVANIEKELGIQPGQTTSDRKYSLQINRCLGACGIAPVIMINEKIYQKVEPKKIMEIISDHVI